jgi:hypothetical protein
VELCIGLLHYKFHSRHHSWISAGPETQFQPARTKILACPGVTSNDGVCVCVCVCVCIHTHTHTHIHTHTHTHIIYI